jgi:hypothetical protein
MWCIVTGWYRFGRIVDVSRQILHDLYGRDQSVPFHVSDQLDATGSGSDGPKRKEGKAHRKGHRQRGQRL